MHDARELVTAAVERANSVQSAWQASSVRTRALGLRRFHDRLLERSDDVLDAIQADTGKARRDALSEVLAVASIARTYGTRGPRWLRSERRRGGLPLLTRATVDHEPYGVVGAIVPWNYPFLLGIGDALAALLAGNAVVIKPSELTVRSTGVALELLREAGLPDGLVSIVHGDGRDVGNALIGAVDYVCFTGSTAVGREVAAAAACRLVPCSLELGGKNAAIITRDARLADVVPGLIAGSFANAGQSCISIERAYVEHQLYEPLRDALAEQVGTLRLEANGDLGADVGALISEAHADSVEQHVRQAVADGASVVVGGTRRHDLGASVFAPTVLVDVPCSTPLAREETFGPVVALYPVDDVEEAIRRANDTHYGLNASVWAGSRRTARAIARRINAGSVCSNATLLAYAATDAEMGGWGASGIGRRNGPDGIRRFTRSRSRHESFARGGGFDRILAAASTPKRARWLLRVYALWRRIPFVR